MKRSTKRFTAHLLLLLVFSAGELYAQTFSQEIHGAVLDKDSRLPLENAIISLKEQPDHAGISDSSGRFVLREVKIGRHTLVVRRQGYKTQVKPGLLVSSGKQLQLIIELESSAEMIEGVVISASRYPKGNPLNNMSLASSHLISVEETLRFPGSANDPARMIQSFAGVQGGELGGNELIIRGNSSKGLLWRVEGAEAYNPTHFSFEGSSFGGISMITNTALANSDFSTAAFNAEYGNALSGVFDLRLRNGNTEKREYTLQAGTMGLEAAMEGPFSRGYGGSYLINFRYSTLSLFESIGLTPSAPAWQDAVIKLHLPAGKAGEFSVYAIGGLGNSPVEAEKDSLEWAKGKEERFSEDFDTGTGIIGIQHHLNFKKSYLNTSLSANFSRVRFEQDSLSAAYEAITRQQSRFLNTAYRFNTVYNTRINGKNTLRAGLTTARLGYDFNAQTIDPDIPGRKLQLLDDNGQTGLYQGFVSWKFNPLENLEIVAGLHALYFALNDEFSPEPRISVAYHPGSSGTISAAYGKHSRIEPLSVYFSRVETTPGEFQQTNTGLGLTKAHHYVLGYDHFFPGNLHLKAEFYYQHMYDVPVAYEEEGTFSALNIRYTKRIGYSLKKTFHISGPISVSLIRKINPKVLGRLELILLTSQTASIC